jgi:hypothetical protein
MISSKNYVTRLLVTCLAILLTACGSTPQPTVTLNTNLLANKDLRVGIVYNAPKGKAETHIYGASCLLCYGVASAMTSKLDTHLETTITDNELVNIKDLVTAKYLERTANVTSVELPIAIKKLKKFKGELGFAKKDFRPLKEQLNLDVLVVLDINEHGAYRFFSAYVPNGSPQGYIAGLLYAVDLNSNAYVQHLKIEEKIQPLGEWDEPTDFPSVTTSYYQAIENVKQKINDAI